MRFAWVIAMLLGVFIVEPMSKAAARESQGGAAGYLCIDHTKRDIRELALADILRAKKMLRVVYGHTSHGSQLTEGMKGLVGFANRGGLGLDFPRNVFAFNHGGRNGGLDLHDYFAPGDLGNPDRVTWAKRTREYLEKQENRDVNVVMWSWCGQVTRASEEEIALYLETMTELEEAFPDVTFVYMTGHLAGRYENDNFFARNQQIREYCEKNGKVLYDFADIESWDMSGRYLADKRLRDTCDYDSDGDKRADRNWAREYQEKYEKDVYWYECRAAHTQPLNANLKAYAAWHLFCEIAKRRSMEE
ncbi:hypothetical protein [Poriferisphaera sp. WC338]|uniref:hypothetical protein n=1 Tax=Poriferisphaera sp. WC338 TaxID=3425129 RepID=UPI003D814937